MSYRYAVYCPAASMSHVPSHITNSAENATKNSTKIVEHNNIREKAKHTHKKKGNINHFANMQHIKIPTTTRKIQHEKKSTPNISIKIFSVNTKLKRAQYMLLKISETPNSIQYMKICSCLTHHCANFHNHQPPHSYFEHQMLKTKHHANQPVMIKHVNNV